MHKSRWRLRRACAGVLLAAALVGCGGSQEPAAARRVDVILRDFAIEPDRHVLAPGATDFAAFNEGPTVHELILVRTDLDADQLPLQADGLTAVEEADNVEFVAADEGIDLNRDGGFTATLTPGRYVLYCNLEGHYLAHMRTELEVRKAPT